MTNLSIIIVNWNTSEYLKKCLKSIMLNSKIKNYQVFVVDNASIDDSVKMVKQEFPWVRLIVNKNNLGFAKANNQVLRKIKSKYVLILNPDVEILKNSIENLVNFLNDDENIGLVGPILLNPDRTVQKMGYYRIFPSLMQAWYFYTENYKNSIRSKNLTLKYWEKEISLNKENEVDQLPGACFLAKRRLLKEINFFDDNFPLLFEDVDLSFRIKKQGYKIILTPKSKVIHVGGVSFGKMDEVDFHARFFKSLFIFFDKHKNIFEQILIRLIVIGSLVILVTQKAISQLLKPNPEKEKFVKNKWRLFKCLLA